MIRQHHTISGVIALAAVLTASVAPNAWADPAPLAKAEAAIAANSQAATAVRPNPDQQPTGVALTGSAPAQTATVVRPNPDQQIPALATHRIGYVSPKTRATVVRVISPDGGFDWGDAGIGAIGGFALSVLAIGGAITISRRRTQRSESVLAG
jgi:hypothetical protein